MLPTIGRRHKLEQGMAGLRADLHQRMLSEIDEQARFADELGYYGMGSLSTTSTSKGSNCPPTPSCWTPSLPCAPRT